MKSWGEERVSRLVELSAKHTYEEIGVILGCSAAAVRNKLWRLGVRKKAQEWTPEEESLLVSAYQSSGVAEEIGLTGLAASLGRHKTNVCRKARELGLTNQKRRMVATPKIRKPKFDNDQDRRAHVTKALKDHFATKGHPKGFLGGKHTEETRMKISEKSLAFAGRETDEQKASRILKAGRTRAENGTLYPSRPGATWKAAWREIGGARKYYRSKWEANYAHYLQWLKDRGEIRDWKHEPKTFWFEGIRRGTNSYLPDFWVQENSGAEAYHEVKGWMDDRSKTKIRRMAKYHPNVKLIVIDTKAYAALKRAVQSLIPGWEP
ncbi:hypothetical protein PT7_P068 (plasmid) [Pusillimonas sp. T7-7]|uniref:hypothetical protein n=1 Tax=Pusillimonas sp. (strain T7-7) TaxID=1007105 RepID=UPI0002084BD1|nr:hypothetical protein [Pusillimonas sp. T7-7]AEC22304.1 hypothetical protein PT7_P068 [Pusillimonas sp. T7-7]